MICVSKSSSKIACSRLGAFVLLVSMVAQVASIGSAVASAAIRNEPGDPYNRPPNLPKPHMICAVGEATARFICPARLAPPLTLCTCYGVSDYGRRYFIFEPRRLPTIFSFDGYAW